MGRRAQPDQDTLISWAGPGMGRGPVERAIRKQLKQAAREQALDRVKYAALIAQSISLAGSIDAASGHNPAGRRQSGMQVAALHTAFVACMASLDAAAPLEDPFTELLARLEDTHADADPSSAHPA